MSSARGKFFSWCGATDEVEVSCNQIFESAKEIIDCNRVSFVRLNERLYLLFDEEGLLRGAPPNFKASEIFDMKLFNNVILVAVDKDLVDLTTEEMAKYHSDEGMVALAMRSVHHPNFKDGRWLI